MKRLRRFTMYLMVASLLLMPLAIVPQAARAQVSVKNIQQPFASAARTASVNSSVFEVQDADVLVLYLVVTANSGTSQTLDVKMQDSPDGGTTWFDIAGAAVTQVTTSNGSQIVSATRKFARTVRCVVTIGGTTPSYTFAVFFLAYKSF